MARMILLQILLHCVLNLKVKQSALPKNKYELLWDQESPEGYIKLMAVLQKYIDQLLARRDTLRQRCGLDKASFNAAPGW